MMVSFLFFRPLFQCCKPFREFEITLPKSIQAWYYSFSFLFFFVIIHLSRIYLHLGVMDCVVKIRFFL